MADQTFRGMGSGAGSLLRVVPPAVHEANLARADQQKAALTDQANGLGEVETSSLANYVRAQYEMFRNHRNKSDAGWSERLLSATRVFNGQYDADKLMAIKKFGGSEVYARIISNEQNSLLICDSLIFEF